VEGGEVGGEYGWEHVMQEADGGIDEASGSGK
jgi:hypothetical protein